MTKAKKIEQLDIKSKKVIKIWNSALEAENIEGFNSRRISQVCKGKAIQTGGYLWKYSSENDCEENFEFKKRIKKNILDKKIILWSNDVKDMEMKFDSIEIASKYLNTNKNTIESVCRQQRVFFKDKSDNFKYFNNKILFFEEDYDKNKILNALNSMLYECKICKYKTNSQKSLTTHVQLIHNLSSEEYTTKHLYNNVRPVCKTCEKETRYVSLTFKDYCKEHSKEAMKIGGKIGGKAEAWNRGKTKNDDKRIMRQSILVSGVNNHFYGKQHSSETKQKLSELKKLSEEVILERLDKRKNHFNFIEFDYEKYVSRQQQKIICICIKCKRKQKKTLHALEKGALCKFCYPYTISKAEVEIGDFIEQQLNIPIVRNDRTLIAPKELDIFVPSHSLAIEYNGLYWHKDAGTEAFNKKYHQEKHEACKNKNVKLFQVFSDEWENKSDLIKEMIKHKLSLTKNKLGARQCSIKEIEKNVAKEFFNNSHISGHTKASYYFGLIYKDELLSLISLRKPIQKKYNEYLEIARFSTKPDWNISGGFSKLLKHITLFAKNNGYKGILTYADLRTGSGNVYEKSGFKKIGETGISYWYTDDIKRYDRFSFRAQNGKTEKEIARENNVSKIYGCKNLIYIYEI